MGGGLMQLVAYGAQDIYLTGTLRLLSSRLFTADTLTFPWKVLNRHGMVIILVQVVDAHL